MRLPWRSACYAALSALWCALQGGRVMRSYVVLASVVTYCLTSYASLAAPIPAGMVLVPGGTFTMVTLSSLFASPSVRSRQSLSRAARLQWGRRLLVALLSLNIRLL